METEQLTYPEHRQNFEIDNDPKLYVKDKYHYQNRRRKILFYILGGIVIMIIIVVLSVLLIRNRKTESRGWKVVENNDKVVNNLSTIYSNESLPLATNPTTQFSTEAQITLASTTSEDPQLEAKRKFIKSMAHEAFDKYERYAFGQDVLRPMTKEYSWSLFGLNSGLTLVSSMTTLWVMNMHEEFNRGKEWIQNHLNLSNIIQHINVHHTVTHYIGSLLSCYALSGDVLFLEKAKEISDVLKPAYEGVTGLPYGNIIPKSGFVSDAVPSLASIGGQHLEYSYLSDKTGDSQYRLRIEKIRKFLRDIEKPNGLYIKKIYIETGKWYTDISTFAKSGGNFYSYLIKSYIQSNGKDKEALEMYKSAIDSMESIGIFSTSENSGLVYARNFHRDQVKFGDYMNSDSCYLGAMLAQGVEALKQAKNSIKDARVAKVEMERIDRHWNLALALTETCHQAAVKSKTGLPPHHFYFKGVDDATNTGQKYTEFHLSSDLVESYFILWRLTHDRKWRDYAWNFAQSIYQNCRTDNGYSSLRDVNDQTSLTNYQDAQFIASSLKYLYLIFSNDEQLPLNQWVFNAYGQPLPICQINKAYPECTI